MKPLSSIIKWLRFYKSKNFACVIKKTPQFVPFGSLKTELRWFRKHPQLCVVWWCVQFIVTCCVFRTKAALHLRDATHVSTARHTWFTACLISSSFFWSLAAQKPFIDAKFSITSTHSLNQVPHGVMIHSLISWDVVHIISWWFHIITKFHWMERFHEYCGSGHSGLTTIHPVTLCAWHSASFVTCEGGPCCQGYQAHNIVVQCHSCLYHV